MSPCSLVWRFCSAFHWPPEDDLPCLLRCPHPSSPHSSPALQPAEFLLSGTLGALVVVAAAVVRIFLGWQYVGNRLLSASVEYEETGW